MTGLPRVHHRLTDSTNERAKELAATGAPHGTLVTADEQTAGRGRQGRVWTAPPGSALLMSLVLREVDEFLPLRAAVAVSSALPVASAVKWPNDIWVEGRKVCGILVEGRPQEGWAVLGMGVNVSTQPDEFPEELREVATSLGGVVTREELLSGVLAALDRWLGASPASVLAEWRSRDALYGSHVAWGAGEGVAAGISDSGALLVETAEGAVELDAGEVHLRRN